MIKKNKSILLIISLLFIFSCNQQNDIEKINNLINSNNPDKIIKGYLSINNKNGALFIEKIFDNIDDQRVSHNIKNIGVSVYQSKMIAIKKVSGLEPPRKITYKKDDSIVQFYYKWALNKGYFNDSGSTPNW